MAVIQKPDSTKNMSSAVKMPDGVRNRCPNTTQMTPRPRSPWRSPRSSTASAPERWFPPAS